MKNHKRLANNSLLGEIAWGARHDAFRSEVDRALLRTWQLGASNPEIDAMLQNKVRHLRVQDLFGDLCPFRLPALDYGDLELGHSLAGNAVLIMLNWLCAGLLLLGNTGCGKSSLLKYLIPQIAIYADGLWVTDAYKTEIRHLQPYLRRAGRQMVVLKARSCRFNVLQADGIDPRSHLSLALDILARVLGLPPRSVTILRSVCHQLYCEFGIYNGRTDCWPNLFDLYERILATPGLNAAAREAILDRLGSLLLTLTPQCAAHRLAWRPSDLTRHVIDYEMNGAAEPVKSLNLNYCLFSVLHERVAKGAVNADLRFWVVAEDAQRFLSARPEASAELTPTEELAGLIRTTGTGLCFTAQTTEGLSRGLMANLATKAMGRSGGNDDYQRLGADMGMNAEQIQWAKLNLRPGQFIFQLSEGPFRLPFVVKAPRINIPPVVTDAEADDSIKILGSLPTKPAPEFAHWQPHHLARIVVNAGPAALTEVELRYLAAVIQHPAKPSSYYAKLARISGRKAVDLRVRLVQAGYLREHNVATSNRGRSAIVLEPLESAHSAVGQP